MSLIPVTIRIAKPAATPYKLAGELGLHLLIRPDGARYWRFKYRSAGKKKLLAFGVYASVSLAEAPENSEDAKRVLREGADPGATRKATKLEQKHKADNTFRALADKWMASKRVGGLPAMLREYRAR